MQLVQVNKHAIKYQLMAISVKMNAEMLEIKNTHSRFHLFRNTDKFRMLILKNITLFAIKNTKL